MLPFQPLIATLTNNFINLNSVEGLLLSGWKEYFIVFLFLFVLIRALIKKDLKPKIIKLDYIIGFLFLLAGITFLIFGEDIKELIYGLKYDLLFLLLYLSVRWIKLGKTEIRKLIKFFFFTLSLVIIISFIFLIIPNSHLENLGYSNFNNWQPKMGLQSFQKAWGIDRAFGPLSGPNQLGLYLVFGLAILSGLNKTKKFLFNNWIKYLLTITSIILIILSFSRSAWLALAVVLLIIYLITKNKIKSNKKSYLVISLLLIVASAIVLISIYPDLILRQTDNIRIERLAHSFNLLIDNPLGVGIGKVGPAAQWLNSTKALVSENFYLQIGLELGIIGLIAYIYLLASLIKKTYIKVISQKKSLIKGLNLGLLAGLIGIMVANLFLHSLTDATLAYSLGMIMGLAHNQNI